MTPFRPKCAAAGCSTIALLHTDPPQCRAHVAIFEGWLDDMQAHVNGSNTSDEDREVATLEVVNELRFQLWTDERAGRFYELWMARKSRSGVSASIGDVLLFVLLSAASGVVGNATYDALKVFIARFGKAEEKFFGELVVKEEYESERTTTHTTDENGGEVTVDTQRTITRRHSLLSARFRDGEKKLGP